MKKVLKIEEHDFMNGCYVGESKGTILEKRDSDALIRQRFHEVDIPILCTPELLEENIEKIKQWFIEGGRVNCYSMITTFSHGLSVVTLEDFTNNDFHFNTYNKMGVIDKEGTEKIKCAKSFKDISILNEKLVRVQDLNGTYNLISVESGRVLEPKCLHYIDTEFHDGLLVAIVSSEAMSDGKPQTNKYVYFDESGKVVLSSDKYTSMGQFKNGLALVSEEKCDTSFLSFPTFTIQHRYDYYKSLIDKSGKVVARLGCTESASKMEYPLACEPYNRIKGGKIFQADRYHELNGILTDGLKFEKSYKGIKLNQSFESTEDMRNLILSTYYNPEQEIEKAIKTLKCYTDNCAGGTENMEYNDDTIKETCRKKVPYVYYLNRDSFGINEDYIPPKQKVLK